MWTSTEDKILITRWESGATYQDIADELKRSRSAVAGRAFRLTDLGWLAPRGKRKNPPTNQRVPRRPANVIPASDPVAVSAMLRMRDEVRKAKKVLAEAYDKPLKNNDNS